MSIDSEPANSDRPPLATGENDKSVIRARVRAWRLAMGREERGMRSAKMTRRALELPELSNAQTVHVYWPSETLGEVDTRPLIDELHSRGARVVLPVVVESQTAASRRRLRHVAHSPGARLVSNRWGIFEPAQGTNVDPSELDAVIVPALACDTAGYRLGFGYGFYDEFLPQTEARRICLCYDEALLDSIPRDGHDQRVHIIVTESRVIRPLASLLG